MGDLGNRFTERAVAIGDRNALIGVVTQGVEVDGDKPGIVVLNGGILPRWSRSRVYVTLARQVASLGFRTLRFDISGIGDSPSRDDGLPPIEAALADLSEVLDWFVGKDRPVVLIGLCDGANLAAYRASLDSRVVGVVLIDPLIPRTLRYRVLHIWRRISAFTTWREIVSVQHAVWGRLRTQAASLRRGDPPMTGIDPNSASVRAFLTGVYAKIASKDVQVLAVFSGGMQNRHCYRDQMFEAFPTVGFTDRFQVEYFQANDHHFEWPPHRAWLLERLIQWLTTAPFAKRAGAKPVLPDDAPEAEDERSEILL